MSSLHKLKNLSHSHQIILNGKEWHIYEVLDVPRIIMERMSYNHLMSDDTPIHVSYSVSFAGACENFQHFRHIRDFSQHSFFLEHSILSYCCAYNEVKGRAFFLSEEHAKKYIRYDLMKLVHDS